MFFDRIIEFDNYYNFHDFVDDIEKYYRSINFENKVIEFVKFTK